MDDKQPTTSEPEELKMPELLPCPFCGGDKVHYLETRWGEWMVICPTVGGCTISTGHSPSKEVVRNAWNRRHAAQLHAELAEARALLTECRDYIVLNDHAPEIYLYNSDCVGCQLRDKINAAILAAGGGGG